MRKDFSDGAAFTDGSCGTLSSYPAALQIR